MEGGAKIKIIVNDEEYEIFDAHTHFSNLIARPLKFILKYLSIYEIIDLIFANWKQIKGRTDSRKEKNVELFKLVLDYYHIDKAINLPVFKLDRSLSYKMNKLYPEKMIGFGYINPRSRHLKEDLKELKQKGVKGIKIHPDFMKFNFRKQKEELLDIFRYCANYKILVLSHTGSHSEIKNIIPLLKKSDETKFVIGHSGLCPQSQQALDVARKCPNTFLEISGNPYIFRFMEAIKDPDIGIEKLLFGSDLPSLNPRVEIQKILSLDISKAERKLIFSDNIKRILNE